MTDFDLIICSKDLALAKQAADQAVGLAAGSVEVHVINNTAGTYGLAQAYNMGIRQGESERIVLIHEDAFILTQDWDQKLAAAMTEKTGLLGVAGTQYLGEDAIWYAAGNPTCGAVLHTDGQQVWQSRYGEGAAPGREVVACDGVFLAARRSIITQHELYFDEAFGGFHFYDLSWSLKFLQKGFLNQVVPGIDLLHLGQGELDSEWHRYRRVFQDRYQADLPATISSESRLKADGSSVLKKKVTTPSLVRFAQQAYQFKYRNTSLSPADS